MQTPKRSGSAHSSIIRLLKICRLSQRKNGDPSKIGSLNMKASNTETPDYRPQLLMMPNDLIPHAMKELTAAYQGRLEFHV